MEICLVTHPKNVAELTSFFYDNIAFASLKFNKAIIDKHYITIN
jgi:hypothetical protein